MLSSRSMLPTTLDSVCEFLNGTQGLDKLYRLLSYFSKLIAALLPKLHLLNNSKMMSVHLADSFSKLSRNLGHTRTVMRLVGLLHNLRTLKDFQYEAVNDWKTFKGITRILTNFTYLPCDHLALFGREKIISIDSETIGWLGRTSAQSWFIGLIVEIVDLWKSFRELVKKFNSNLRMGQLGLRASLREMEKDSRPLMAKSFLIIGDLPLSINYSLKEPFMSPLMVGLLGTTSSLAALYIRWKSHQEMSERHRENKLNLLNKS